MDPLRLANRSGLVSPAEIEIVELICAKANTLTNQARRRLT